MLDITNIEPEAKRELVKVINPKEDENNKFDGYNLENILERLINNPTVIGYVLARDDGVLIKTNIDTVASIENISVNSLIENLLRLVQASKRTIKELNPQDDMEYLRINTRKYEFMLSKIDNYILTVIQRNKHWRPTSNKLQ
jgi:dynein light chain roadblock-type